MTKKQHLGSALDDFLEAEGILADTTAIAVKRVLVWQMKEAMTRKKISKTILAKKMRTSRAALNRLLDSKNTSITLRTMNRAASMMGKQLRIELADARKTGKKRSL